MQDLTILISSCDRYQDVWEPFAKLFLKYWPDCPYEIYLLTNYLSSPSKRIITLSVGEDLGWSTNCRIALQQLSSPYILYFQEDYFLTASVNNMSIGNLLSFLKTRRGAYLRLCPVPPPDVPCQDFPFVGEICKGTRYRTSLQAAIWDRKALLTLLRDGETGGDFEVYGSQRSDQLDVPFLGVWKPAIPYYCTAIVRGVWTRGAVGFCRKEGIEIDLTERPQESRTFAFYRTHIAGPLDRVNIGQFGLQKHLIRYVPAQVKKWFHKHLLRMA